MSAIRLELHRRARQTRPERWADRLEAAVIQLKLDMDSIKHLNAGSDSLPELGEGQILTPVIVGTGKSGTTMTIGVLRRLGLMIGNRIDAAGEDRDINLLFTELWPPTRLWRIVFLRRKFGELIASKQQQYPRWGFKSPYITPFLWLLKSKIANPVFIIMTRNTFSTSLSYEKSGKFGWSWRRWYLHIGVLNLLLSVFAVRAKKPVLIASYETAISDPEHFVDHLVAATNLKPTTLMRERAIAFISADKGYQFVGRVKLKIKEATPDIIRGWASDTFEPSTSLVIQARLYGNVVSETVADILRPATVAKGFHETGHCGFKLTFDPPLAPTDVGCIELYAPEIDESLFIPPRNPT